MTPVDMLFSFIAPIRCENCGYIITFIAVFLEGAVFIGILIPSELVVVLSGFLAFQGYLQPEICFWIISIGAVLGDTTGYCIGRASGKDYFTKHKRLFFLRAKHINKTLELLQQQGNVSIFLSKFLAGLRATIPFTAGASGIPYRQFLINSVAGTIIWTAAFISLGLLLGLSWVLIEVWSGKTGAFVFFIVTIIAGFAYIYWTAVKRPADDVIVSKYVVVIPPAFLLRFNQRHPLASAFFGKRLAVDSYLGLNLTTRLVIGIIFLWIFAEITIDILISDPLVVLDQRVLGNIVYFRTPSLTKLMVIFSQAGGEITQTIGAIVLIIYFSYKRRFDYLAAYLAAMIGGSILVFGLKAAIHRLRPLAPASGPVMFNATGWSFPSGHSMMSLLFYGMLTYFLVRNIGSRRFRILIAITGAFIIFIIGLSRIYLQVHFLSDVLAGYAGGLFWLIVCITALEIYREKRDEPDAIR